MVSFSVIRELGPVITALIFAGRVSSGIGAELSSMRVTEQIDAMEVSAIDPYRYLVVTRILACTFIMPVITIYVDLSGIDGRLHCDSSFNRKQIFSFIQMQLINLWSFQIWSRRLQKHLFLVS